MDNLSSTFKRDAKLQSILTAPTLSVSDKQQIIGEIQKSIGVQDKGDTIKNFLNTLAANNRLSVLEGVTEKFALLMSASRGEVEMTITSAAPLDQKVVKQLEATVSKSSFVGSGKKLKVVPKVSSFSGDLDFDNVLTYHAGQPRYPRWSDRRDWRPHNRPERVCQDGAHEQATPRHVVNM